MAVVLSPDIHETIFEDVKRSFGDFLEFDCLVADKLKQALKDSNEFEINMKTTKKLAERYYDVGAFKTPEHKALFAHVSIIFKAAIVLVLSHHESHQKLLWSSTEELLAEYPEFNEECDKEELQYLLRFRNMLRLTLLIIPAALNKEKLLKIAGRLEGSQNVYITGGGQKKEVCRRVQIYEREGGVGVRKRRPAASGERGIKMRRKAEEEAAELNHFAAAVPRHHNDELLVHYNSSSLAIATNTANNTAVVAAKETFHIGEVDSYTDRNAPASNYTRVAPAAVSTERDEDHPVFPSHISLPSPLLRSHSFINAFEFDPADLMDELHAAPLDANNILSFCTTTTSATNYHNAATDVCNSALQRQQQFSWHQSNTYPNPNHQQMLQLQRLSSAEAFCSVFGVDTLLSPSDGAEDSPGKVLREWGVR